MNAARSLSTPDRTPRILQDLEAVRENLLTETRPGPCLVFFLGTREDRRRNTARSWSRGGVRWPIL